MLIKDLHGDGHHGNIVETVGIPLGWKLMLQVEHTQVYCNVAAKTGLCNIKFRK